MGGSACCCWGPHIAKLPIELNPNGLPFPRPHHVNVVPEYPPGTSAASQPASPSSLILVSILRTLQYLLHNGRAEYTYSPPFLRNLH
jgi:hypothetical protein